MNRKTLARIATMSLALGISTIACTPGGQGGHPAALADTTPKPDPRAGKSALRMAQQARTALAAHQGDAAVAAAEKAVALQSDDAGYRMLLGQAYLANGRFGSADASFHDSLTLSPDQPKARFDMALAEIAQGRSADAQAILHGLNGAIPAGDLGLALALSGDRQSAIAMLTDLVRSGKSDARSRQNLALTFALDGRWREARAVAMQDTTPDKIDAQLAHWAELAKPTETGSTRVASMLGVRPRADPGLPSELALAPPAPTVVPVALASSQGSADQAPVSTTPAVPVALAVAAAPAAPVSTPVSTPVSAPVAVAQGNSVTLPLDAPLPAAMPANAPASAVVLAAQTHEKRSDLAPPPLLRAPSAAVRSPIRSAMLVQPVHAAVLSSGGYVVQLGAYAHAHAIQTAWSQASRLMPRLAGFSAARAQFSFSGSSLVRLSVTGFSDHASAAALCSQIRAKGGACFVRAAAGDARIQWASLDKPVQLASR